MGGRGGYFLIGVIRREKLILGLADYKSEGNFTLNFSNSIVHNRYTVMMYLFHKTHLNNNTAALRNAMPEELCLLEVHKHVVHCIGAPRRAPESNTFFGPKGAQHAKRPQFGLSQINPNFVLERFRTIINRYSKNRRRSSSSPDELFFFSPEMDVKGMTYCVTVFSSGPV